MESKGDGLNWGNVMVAGVVGTIFFGILSFVTNNSEGTDFDIILVLVLISACVTIIGYIGKVLAEKKEQNYLIANQQVFQKEYNDHIRKLGVVKSNTQGTLIQLDDEDIQHNVKQYLWITDGILHMFPMVNHYLNCVSSVRRPDISKLEITKIPLDSILYFEEIGELYRHAVVSGGESKYSALAEAVISEPIRTKIVSEDYRVVELLYKNRKGGTENLEFEHDAYEVFRKIMPMKDLRKIESLKTVQTKTEKKRPPSAKKQLRQLKELWEEGLITEEEYLEQKKKLLDFIIE